MIVTGAVTTGEEPLIAGMTYTFQLGASRNGERFDLTGTTVTLIITNPAGTATNYATTIAAGAATSVAVTLTQSDGTWLRRWRIVQGGSTLYTDKRAFDVEAP